MSAKTQPGKSSIKELMSSRCYERSGTIVELNRDIDKLERIDKDAERHIKKARLLTFIPLVGIFISALTAGALSSISALICALISIWGIIEWGHWAKLDFSDFRYGLGKELLALCARDILESGKITLKIEFKPVNRKGTQFRKTSDRTIYRDTWMLLSGVFADGSKFNLQIEETVHVKFRKGKYKAKGYLMSLTVAFSKKSYGVLQLENIASNSLVRLEESSQLKACRGKGNAVYLAAKVPPLGIYPFKPEVAINKFSLLAKYLLLSAYGILNATKKSGASA